MADCGLAVALPPPDAAAAAAGRSQGTVFPGFPPGHGEREHGVAACWAWAGEATQVHAIFFIRDIGDVQLVLSLKKSWFLTRLVSYRVS